MYLIIIFSKTNKAFKLLLQWKLFYVSRET